MLTMTPEQVSRPKYIPTSSRYCDCCQSDVLIAAVAVSSAIFVSATVGPHASTPEARMLPAATPMILPALHMHSKRPQAPK